MSTDRQEAAKAEVQKLLKARVIQEIDHPEWLANPVLVRKSNSKWRMMPFGLRNAGATFARLVYKVLYKQLGQNVEAYVDDIVVKSRKAFDHASDLQETFDNLCAVAFDELKQYLQSPPALINLAPGSELLLHLAASSVAVSAALVQETESGQKPVYFVSEALQGAKIRYIEMEKLAYALVMASRKLKHYFQAYKVTVLSQYPLGEVLRGKEVTGRLSKWAAELSPFDLHYVARTAIKSQVLADFVAEWTPAFALEPEPVEQPWVMYSDGSWSHKGAGAAAVLTSPGGVPIRYAARLQFDKTNNAAEYEAILLGLKKAKALGVQRLLIRTDSKLVASHVEKSFEAKEEGMKRYLEAVRSLEKCFADITASFFEVLYTPSVPIESLDIMAIDQAELGEDPEDWRTPFVKYLKNDWLPEDEAEAKRLQLRAAEYKLVSGQLYRSGVLQPLLRCISFAEGEEMAK
ncbi:uncharacterized protein LOC127766277 [Oryza glaberrima]|uniref:uncharacterized protein LOC127766277 n=1 Tax=Oryza glaberrima TaxID=4538 RepID=UPI00224C4F7E|nr:uncharacterized protein LOC127766277 [Oryza glaberrima]